MLMVAVLFARLVAAQQHLLVAFAALSKSLAVHERYTSFRIALDSARLESSCAEGVRHLLPAAPRPSHPATGRAAGGRAEPKAQPASGPQDRAAAACGCADEDADSDEDLALFGPRETLQLRLEPFAVLERGRDGVAAEGGAEILDRYSTLFSLVFRLDHFNVLGHARLPFLRVSEPRGIIPQVHVWELLAVRCAV